MTVFVRFRFENVSLKTVPWLFAASLIGCAVEIAVAVE